MWLWERSSRGSTWPRRAAVRKPSIAEFTFNGRRLTCPAWAARHAEPWSPKISAISRAGRAMIGGLCRRLLLRCQRSEPIQRAHDRADHVGGYLRVERGGIEPGMSEQS